DRHGARRRRDHAAGRTQETANDLLTRHVRPPVLTPALVRVPAHDLGARVRAWVRFQPLDRVPLRIGRTSLTVECRMHDDGSPLPRFRGARATTSTGGAGN